MKRVKIDQMMILSFFTITYVICPHYFQIIGVPVRDMILFAGFLGIVLWKTDFKLYFTKDTKSLLYAICVWSGIHALLQLIHSEYFYVIRQLLLWTGIVLFGAKVINTKEKFLKLIDILIGTAVVIGCFGFIEEFFGFNLFSLLNTVNAPMNYNAERFGMIRIISFTSHAITYCSYCMLILGLIFYRIQTRKKEKNVIYIAAYLIVAANAFFTVSRSAWIVIAVSQILLLMFWDFKKFCKIAGRLLLIAIPIGIFAYIFISDIRDIVNTAVYMVLAMFDYKYVQLLEQAGITDNANAIGHRFDLYRWVVEDLGNQIVLGKGRFTEFAYKIHYSDGGITIKESIEVEWLRTLYRYGIFGLLTEIYLYASLLWTTCRKSWKKAQEWEGNLSFVRAFFAIIISYVALLFAVMQNEENQLLSIMVMLLIAYITHNGFANENSTIEQFDIKKAVIEFVSKVRKRIGK